ncbi:TetR/AcrR family transcriptional regulator [Pyxidicoccus sp. 3LFB2]
MRVSKEQAARNRQSIIDTASRLFRERGVDGVGVADLMKEAGFTHGGFYNHFPSKEALVVEACGSAFEEALAGLMKSLDSGKGRSGAAFSRYVEQYLTPRHRDDASSGCPMAGLAVDAGRQGEEVQSAYAAGLEKVLEVFAGQLSRSAPDAKGEDSATRERAMRLLSEMVGALVLARAVAEANPTLSEEILQASRKSFSK